MQGTRVTKRAIPAAKRFITNCKMLCKVSDYKKNSALIGHASGVKPLNVPKLATACRVSNTLNHYKPKINHV